jgi:hypothetical protein
VQSTPLRLLLALISAPTAAWAACPAALDDTGFRSQVDTAQEAIDSGDVIAHGAAWRTLQQTIPCLEGPVSAEDWARFLVGYAVVEHALGRDWQPALRTALRIDPDVPRDYGPEALRTWTPTPRAEPATSLVEGVWVDGTPARTAPVLEGPHILQRRAGTGWTSVVLTDAELPSDWAAPRSAVVPDPVPAVVPAAPEPRTRRPGAALRITGWSLAGLGAVGGAATWAYSRPAIRDSDGDDAWTEDEVQVVRVGNMASWGLCGAGVAVAVVGHVQKPRPVTVSVGPGGVGLHLRR